MQNNSEDSGLTALKGISILIIFLTAFGLIVWPIYKQSVTSLDNIRRMNRDGMQYEIPKRPHPVITK
jgi:hypothetical protein